MAQYDRALRSHCHCLGHPQVPSWSWLHPSPGHHHHLPLHHLRDHHRHHRRRHWCCLPPKRTRFHPVIQKENKTQLLMGPLGTEVKPIGSRCVVCKIQRAILLSGEWTLLLRSIQWNDINVISLSLLLRGTVSAWDLQAVIPMYNVSYLKCYPLRKQSSIPSLRMWTWSLSKTNQSLLTGDFASGQTCTMVESQQASLCIFLDILKWGVMHMIIKP